jgi:hypothetical protein
MLKFLADQWLKALATMRDAGMAHGDLQHGNVIVDESNSLRLVDDGHGCWMQMETEYVHYFVRGGCPALIPHQSVRGHYHPNRRNIQIVFIQGGKLKKEWWLINSSMNLPPPQ